jgi:bifunctional oligoribonuclease and PAP phosphatase NrnA
MNTNLLSATEEATLRTVIAESKNIIITCHKSPDGDAIGASLAWAEYLLTQGKEPTIVVPDAYPDFLHWMPGTETIVRYDKHTEKAEALLHDADLIFCLDFNGTDRVDEMKGALEAATAKRVMIDHHLNPQMETVLTVSHPTMSSTCELVFRIITQLGGFEEMGKKCAVCIYCGMMTDTGGFTYNSTAPEIFYIISQLLTKGIDKDKIYRNVYNNYSPWAIRLRGYIMSQKLNVFNDLHASYFSISRQNMRDFHFIKGDAEGLVNEPLRIKGMRLSVSLREDDRRDNLIWVSLRSVDDFPCNKVAAEFFNGGGHLNASGGRLNCSLEEAEKVVRRAFEHYADLLQRKS